MHSDSLRPLTFEELEIVAGGLGSYSSIDDSQSNNGTGYQSSADIPSRTVDNTTNIYTQNDVDGDGKTDPGFYRGSDGKQYFLETVTTAGGREYYLHPVTSIEAHTAQNGYSFSSGLGFGGDGPSGGITYTTSTTQASAVVIYDPNVSKSVIPVNH